MKKENKDYLDAHRDALEEITKAQTCKKANAIKGDLVRIMREEFYPGYTIDDSCISCLFNMVPMLYQRYDKWLSEQPDPAAAAAVPVEKPPAPEKMWASFPAHDAVIIFSGEKTASISVTPENIPEVLLPKNKNHKRK